MANHSVKLMGILFLICFGVFGAVNTEGQKGVVRTLSAKTYGTAKLDVELGLNYAYGKDFIQELVVDGVSKGKADAIMMSNTINLCFGATPFMDIAASLPIYYDKANIKGGESESDGGLGDPSFSVKILYPPPGKPRVFHQAYFFRGTIPNSGNKNSGIFPRHTCYFNEDDTDHYPMKESFYTTNCFTFEPMMLWTFDIGSVVPKFQFQIDANFGALFSSDPDRNNLLLGNIALEYAPVKVFCIFVDFTTQMRWQNFTDGFKLGSDPLMLSPGVRVNTPVGIYFLLAGDFALLSSENKERWSPKHAPVNNWDYKTTVAPKLGFQFTLGLNVFLTAQDEDKDGIKDNKDRCPKDPEDIDGFEDKDGCPDPDNDKDGINDPKDKCPDKAEDKDGFEDEDGCPDPDNDGDGIPDLEDRCPNVAEDKDGIEDEDGCPEGDNDNDGIPDSLDKCPNEPEDIDNFEDDDGCPDPDNDNDGIPDLKDKCPNKPETLNGFEDEDGCPDKKLKKKKSDMPKHQILEGVRFSSGSSSMTYSSYPYLEPIIKAMKEFPGIQIEVRGYTDSVGKYESNVRLSQKRAESVRSYLIKKGIDPGRVHAIGHGPSNPVANNRTAAGRAKNRRIEIVRIK